MYNRGYLQKATGCLVIGISAVPGRIESRKRKGSFMGLLPRIQLAILVVSALSGLVCAPTASTGTVLGLVTDPSGARRARGNRGGGRRLHEGRTPGDGECGGPLLVRRPTFTNRRRTTGPPGTYSIRATAAGFQQAAVPSVEVDVTKSYTINLQLAIGEAR
jgi:hypothetical protein